MAKAKFPIGVFVALFDQQRKILLVKHSYGIKMWSLPGGGLEQEETIESGAKREVKEETGLNIKIIKVIGVYEQIHGSSQYRGSIKIILVEGQVCGGKLKKKTRETTNARFFKKEDLPGDVYPGQRLLIADAFSNRPSAFLKNLESDT